MGETHGVESTSNTSSEQVTHVTPSQTRLYLACDSLWTRHPCTQQWAWAWSGAAWQASRGAGQTKQPGRHADRDAPREARARTTHLLPRHIQLLLQAFQNGEALVTSSHVAPDAGPTPQSHVVAVRVVRPLHRLHQAPLLAVHMQQLHQRVGAPPCRPGVGDERGDRGDRRSIRPAARALAQLPAGRERGVRASSRTQHMRQAEGGFLRRARVGRR